MAIKIICGNPKCRNPITFPDSMAGIKVPCEKCGAVNLVPGSDQQSAMAKGPEAKRLGRYTIVSKIGEGGMGAVYEAIQDGLGRRVAMKVLSSQWSSNPAFVARFEREARAVAALNHSNIVTIFEIGQDQGLHFFSMEFVEGESLQTKIDKHKKIPVAEALGYMIQATQGLKHAWEHQLIHRDIKPANLLVTHQGHLKIADLGLAKSTSENDTAPKLTASGIVMGTIYYMSPEQAQGGNLDIRTDIYSLGATFYHLVTGELPFLGQSPIEVMMNLAKKALRPARGLNPDIPPPVAALIHKMLAKSPEERYQNPAELLKELEHLKASLPSAAKGPPQATGKPDFVLSAEDVVAAVKPASRLRSPALLAGIAAGAAALALLAWWMFSGGKGDTPQPVAQTPASGTGTPQMPGDRELEHRRLFESASTYAKDHPGDYEKLIEQYKVVEKVAERSEYGFRAMERRMEAEKAWAEETWQKIQAKAEKLGDADQFKEALLTLDEFPENLEHVLAVENKPDLRRSLDARAKERFQALSVEAAKASEAGNFDEAKARYELARTFGIREISEAAAQEIENLEEARKRAQREAEQLYEKFSGEAKSLLRERRYAVALLKLQNLAQSPRYQSLATRIQADQAEIQKVQKAYDAAMEGLLAKKGQSFAIKGMSGTLVDVKEEEIILSISGAEISQPLSALTPKELGRLAAKKLAESPGEGALCRALFLFYEGELDEAEKALKEASDSGLDVTLYQARLEMAQQEKKEKEAEKEPAAGAEEGWDEAEKKQLRKEEIEKREKLVAKVKAIEKQLHDNTNQKLKDQARDLEAEYRIAKSRWDDTLDSYKNYNRKQDNYYRAQKANFVKTKETYDNGMYEIKKRKEKSYESVHGNALKLMRKIRAGKYPDLDSQGVEDILTGREKLD